MVDTTEAESIELGVLNELEELDVELELAAVSESRLEELLEDAIDEDESGCVDVTTTVGLLTADVTDVAVEATELGLDTGTDTTGEDDDEEEAEVEVELVLMIADVVATVGVTAALVLAAVCCPPISIEAEVSWSVWL